MSGETERQPSAWTPDLLYIHLQSQLDSMQAMLDERYSTQTKALDAAFVAADKAVQAALQAAEKAVTKAETASEKRFESVNEFRAQLAEVMASLITRTEADARFVAITEKLDAAIKRLDMIQGKSAGISASAGTLYAVIGLVTSVIIVAVVLINAAGG